MIGGSGAKLLLGGPSGEDEASFRTVHPPRSTVVSNLPILPISDLSRFRVLAACVVLRAERMLGTY